MTRIRLFLSQKPAGFITFSETECRMRPDGLVSGDLIDGLRRELEAGCVAGKVDRYRWYRQPLPFCPNDVTKPCPCDDEVCEPDRTF
jgi:hypothetical protein